MQLPVTKCDMGTQTDTHPLESNIVSAYEWNEWELRRKAIKLVSLSMSREYITTLYAGLTTKQNAYKLIVGPRNKMKRDTVLSWNTDTQSAHRV